MFSSHCKGFAVIQSTLQSNGFRMGTSQAFLNPIRGTRDNLTIYKFSLVHKVMRGTKILIEVKSHVEYISEGIV